MEVLIASAIAVLAAVAVYLFLRARAYEAILGFVLSSHAAHLFVLAMGRPVQGSAPYLGEAGIGPKALDDAGGRASSTASLPPAGGSVSELRARTAAISPPLEPETRISLLQSSLR